MEREATGFAQRLEEGSEREDKFEIFGRTSRRLELPLSKQQDTGGAGL